jgi:ADP-ribose pyrophosphatase YjhB (NUDIX family)
MPVTPTELYQIADELRAIAQMGQRYTQNDYDTDRYRRVLEISLRLLAGLEDQSDEAITRTFHENDWFHVSPAAGAEAVVFRDDRILLIQRKDDGLWAVPGGLVEVGETLAEAAERELWEEAGVHARVTRLLGVFDSRLWGWRSKVQFYGVVFLADAGDAAPVAGPEALDVGFFAEDRLPPLSPGHESRVPLLFRMLRGEIATPYFDPGLNPPATR